MKKTLFLISCAIVLIISKSSAQSTGIAKLNLELSDAVSITIDNTPVNFAFKTTTNYEKGITATASNHIKITSSGGFQVTVTSPLTLKGKSNAANTIDANTITVTPSVSAGNTDPGISIQPQALGSATPAVLFSYTKGTMPLSLDVAYKTKEGAYIGKAPDIYTLDVTYEITSK